MDILIKILNVLAIPSFILCIIAFIYAVKQNKKAVKAEFEISELKQAMTSYNYLKKLAFSHYENGKYDECLDVFKKYLLDNRDKNERNEILLHIVTKETMKLYSNFLVFPDEKLPKFSLLAQTFISYEEYFANFSYPVLVKTLVNDYCSIFSTNRLHSEFLIALFDKDWIKANEYLSKFSINKDDGLSNCFHKYLNNYMSIKLKINSDDDFSNEIPF